jgi:hypothetical protein
MRLNSVGNSDSQAPVNRADRVKAGLHRVENNVRRQVRVIAHNLSATFHHEDAEETPSRQVRQGIVSINVQDVETMQCTGRKRA